MYLTTQALVLRVTDYNDSDALITLLTREHGKLTAKARGLRRKRSPLVAPCQLLAYGSFTLFEYKGMYIQSQYFWNLFLETGSPEMYVMYNQARRMEEADVSDYQGSGAASL